ncbi:unnamed protein product [Prunus brigantina]
MEMRLVACERMSGTQCSKKTPLSLCFGKQLVCNGEEACRLRAYVRDMTLSVARLAYVRRRVDESGSFVLLLETLWPVWPTSGDVSIRLVTILDLLDGLLIVARCELLLLSCISNNGLLSFFFEHVKVDFICL